VGGKCINIKASSESGECASLISTGFFLGPGGCLWPGMGLSVSFQVQPRSGCLARALVLPRETFRGGEGLSETNGRKLARRKACVALAGHSCKTEPSILMSGEQLEGAKKENRGSQRLKRRDHSGNGVVEGGAASSRVARISAAT